jgi:hypothetical protein
MVSQKINIEAAWRNLFEKHDIVSRVSKDGSFRISASEINLVKEARLMAKFDQSSQLPAIFRENNLSILPVTRGEYIIGPFATHKKVEYTAVKPSPVNIPDLQTLDSTNLYSEASALLFAYNSGIIGDILGEPKVALTVNGRMSSGSFAYEIDNRNTPNERARISVQNAQVEIDAGYESSRAFCVCEAKNIAAEELLIRQLYYPYRLWSGKISKPVVPVFLVFSNDVFHVFIYKFEDMEFYNSIRLLEHRAYTFADEDISLQEVIALWKNTPPIAEPEVPFPQADSFERVLDLLSVLSEASLTRDEVTLQYEFDPRQTNYYISACEYLGLIEREENVSGEREYKLSPAARAIMRQRYKPKHLALMKKILENPVFHKVFGLTLESSAVPDKRTICKVMDECNLRIGQTTIDRRASTVRAWIDWILALSVSD